ncbi:MAG: right-handed parallel beta-helix repeat-containing protein [archaeon]
MKLKIFIVCLLFVLLVVIGCTVDISGCTVITYPGEYNLIADVLNNDSATCIEITTSNVILNGNYHVIDGINAANTYGIKVYGGAITNVTIKNINLSNWAYSIHITNVTSSSIENCFIYDQPSNTYYVYATNLNNTNISNNKFQDYQLGSNTFTYISTGDGNLIKNNNFTAVNISKGISLNSVQNSKIDNNYFNNSWVRHVELASSNGINITSNIFLGGNLGSGYWPQAIRIFSSSSNIIIKNNTVLPYYDTGFLITDSSRNITIEDNYVNATNDIGTYVAYNIIIRNNKFDTRSASLYAIGFRNSQNISIYNNVFNYTVRWLYVNGTQNVDFYNNTGYTSIAYSEYNESIFINNSAYVNITNNLLGLSSTINILEIYSSNWINIINNTILNYSGYGIYLNSAANLNVKNNKFYTPYSSPPIAHIYGYGVNSTNISFNELNSTNITYGIFLEANSLYNRIEYNSIYTLRGTGIYIKDSQNNTINNNTIICQPATSPKFYLGGEYYSNGIFLSSSHYNNVTGNQINASTNSLISTAYSTYNLIENNRLKEVSGSTSIAISSGSAFNVIRNNSICENVSVSCNLALLLIRCDNSGSCPHDNLITNNTFANNYKSTIEPWLGGAVITVSTRVISESPYNNTIVNNTIYSSSRGILFWNVTFPNYFYNNKIENMQNESIYLYNSSGIIFENNTIKSSLTSTPYHFFSYYSSNMTINNNIFNFTSNSISQIHMMLNASWNNNISNNVFECVNCSSAIYIAHDGVTTPIKQKITNNRINNFRDYGVYLASASNSTIFNNTISTNLPTSSIGISFPATTKGNNYYNVSSNIISGTKYAGIYSYVLTSSIFVDNKISPSSGYSLYSTSTWTRNNEFNNNSFSFFPLKMEGGPFNQTFVENIFENISDPGGAVQIIGFGGARDNTTENFTFYKNNITNVVIGFTINNVSIVSILNNNILNATLKGINLINTTNSNISNNFIKDSKYCIYLISSSNNTFANNSINNCTDLDFYSAQNSSENEIINLQSSEIKFSFLGKDVTVKSLNEENVPPNPSKHNNIRKWVDASNNSLDSWLFINFTYTDDEITNVDENTLRIWKYTGTWWNDSFFNINEVDAEHNAVYANITEFGSIFAPLGFDILPPNITDGPNVTTTINSATISWITDELTNYAITYSDGDGSWSVSSSHFDYYHQVALNNLRDGVTYFYNITIWDEAGNNHTYSGYNFTTPEVIEILYPAPEDKLEFILTVLLTIFFLCLHNKKEINKKLHLYLIN